MLICTDEIIHQMFKEVLSTFLKWVKLGDNRCMCSFECVCVCVSVCVSVCVFIFVTCIYISSSILFFIVAITKPFLFYIIY